MSKLDLWLKVCKTKISNTKNATVSGNSITSICAQSQRKAATEQFGPFGIGWGVSEEQNSWNFSKHGDTELCRYSAKLWYYLNDKRGEIPINACIKIAYVTKSGSGYLKVDDEYSKKVQTNAITKGLSTLGFNSDVFEGLYDDNKYIEALKAEEAEANKVDLDVNSAKYTEIHNSFAKAKNKEDVKAFWLSKFNISNDLLKKLMAAKPLIFKESERFEEIKEKVFSFAVDIETVLEHYDLPEEEQEILRNGVKK